MMETTNYFMSDAFHKDAVESVCEAIEKASALGLPAAHTAAIALPNIPVIVKLTAFCNLH